MAAVLYPELTFTRSAHANNTTFMRYRHLHPAAPAAVHSIHKSQRVRVQMMVHVLLNQMKVFHDRDIDVRSTLKCRLSNSDSEDLRSAEAIMSYRQVGNVMPADHGVSLLMMQFVQHHSRCIRVFHQSNLRIVPEAPARACSCYRRTRHYLARSLVSGKTRIRIQDYKH